MNTLYLILVSLLLCGYPLPSTDGAVGVSYGGTGLSTNPVSLVRAVAMMKKKGINSVKIYSPDPTTLTALKGSVPLCNIPSIPSFDLGTLRCSVGLRTHSLSTISTSAILRKIDSRSPLISYASYRSPEIQRRILKRQISSHILTYREAELESHHSVSLPFHRHASHEWLAQFRHASCRSKPASCSGVGGYQRGPLPASNPHHCHRSEYSHRHCDSSFHHNHHHTCV